MTDLNGIGYPPPTDARGVLADYRHIDPAEAREAGDSKVGEGTPATAPEEVPEPGDWDGPGRLAGTRWRLRSLLGRPAPAD